MSGAGWRAIIQCPPRRPGGERPHEPRPVRQDQTIIALANVSRARRTAFRAMADASDRVRTPIALSTASRPEASGGKPQGRTDEARKGTGIRPWRSSTGTTAPAVRKRRSGTIRTLATPDQRSAAGRSLKGTEPQERRIALACLRRCIRQFWRRRAQAIPTIVRAIATAYGRALEVALDAVAVTGLKRHGRLVSSSVAVPIGKGEANARDAT